MLTSEQMCRRIRQRVSQTGLRIQIVRADMRDFGLTEPVDLAITMLDSVSHLLTLDDLVMYLSCIGDNLREGGCCIVEMSHPRDFIGSRPSTATQWTAARGEERVTVHWGGGLEGDPDPIDPITQVSAARVIMEYVRDSEPPVQIDDVVLQRGWTATEVEAAVRLTNCMVIAKRYGSFEGDPLEGDDAWRMIIVLRRNTRAAPEQMLAKADAAVADQHTRQARITQRWGTALDACYMVTKRAAELGALAAQPRPQATTPRTPPVSASPAPARVR